MYPGEGMYLTEEPPPHHHHHLPKMADDDDDDNNDDEHDHHHHGHDHHEHDHHHHHQDSPNPGHKHHKHPPSNTPPPRHHHRPTPPKRSPPTPLRPQQPLQPPTPIIPPQPLQPPTPIIPQPPLQPPQQVSAAPSPPPPSTPRKPHAPPPMNLNHPHHYNDGDDDDKYKSPHRQLSAALFIVLLLFGIIALILWLIYRPSKPHFTAVAALVYSLNATTTAAATTATTPSFVSASMQFVIHTRNPNKRTTLSYDRLAATVFYRNTAITPPVPLSPLFHRKKSSVLIAPVIGGPPVAVAVPVGADVVNGLAADEAYGVVGFSWVLVGRVRYRAGGFKSGHSRVYVRCDVWVRLNGISGGLYTNPGGQVPLLGAPPCFVDI